MNALTPIETDNRISPQFGFHRGDVVLLGDPACDKSRQFVFQARHATTGGVSRLQFANVETSETIFRSDVELAILMANGHFDVYAARDMRGLPRQIQSALALTDAQKAKIARRKAYAMILLDLPEDFVGNKRGHVVAESHRVAAKLGDKAPLSYNTIVTYAEIFRRRHDVFGDACLASPRNPGRRLADGNFATADAKLIAEATQQGVLAAVAMKKGAGENAMSSARNWLDECGRSDLHARLPSLRTFQRRMFEMDRFSFDAVRFGARQARRKWSAYREQKRPELPLEEVECDHTTMDIQVFDETRGMLWGRPDIITFRDRATGVVLGFAIGFESPSYASFMQGLRHAMYPKDPSNGPKGVLNGWPYFGKPKRLLVDNALHFVGEDIRHACGQLGIEKVEFRPGNPWLKGAEERLNRIIGYKVHNLGGATMSNATERKMYKEVEEPPALTLRELECFLIKFFADDYNVSNHMGLGFLRRLEGNPARLWAERRHLISLDFLPNPDMFVASAGNTDWRGINHTGIVWDYVVYQSDALNVIRTHHKHRTGTGKHRGTQYRVVRDPYDIGKINVWNSYAPDDRPLVVPAVRADYAAGLSLHQHKVHIANWTAKQLAEAEDAIDLLKSTRDAAQRAIDGLKKRRNKADIARSIARYVDAESRKERASLSRPDAVSEVASAEPIDPAAPELLPLREPRSADAMDSTRTPGAADSGSPNRMDASDAGALAKPIDPGTSEVRTFVERPVEEPVAPSATADLETLRSKHKGFD